MKHVLAVLLVASAFTTGGCGLIFGTPMNRDQFQQARESCGLGSAIFTEGSFIKGDVSIIDAPPGISPRDWDGKLECIARLFGGDGVTKKSSVNFILRFNG